MQLLPFCFPASACRFRDNSKVFTSKPAHTYTQHTHITHTACPLLPSYLSLNVKNKKGCLTAAHTRAHTHSFFLPSTFLPLFAGLKIVHKCRAWEELTPMRPTKLSQVRPAWVRAKKDKMKRKMKRMEKMRGEWEGTV